MTTQLTPVQADWPALRQGIDITPQPESGKVVVSLPEGAYLRMGQDAADLLGDLDGTRSRDAVLACWTTRLSEEQATTLLHHFTQLGLLESDITPSSAGSCRSFRFRKPATVQLVLYRPQRMTDALRRVGTLARQWPALAGYALLLGAGAAAALTHLHAAGAVLLRPSWGMWWHIALAMLIVNAVHELGHATALAYHGGRPRAMGVMLLYFVCPAFFCDVSATWRLGRRQRAAVALAGITVNAAAAAAAALAAAADLGGHQEFCWRLAAANVFTIVFNLLPFIKLDGYLLLLAFVDESHLRPRAMADARNWLSHHLYRRPANEHEFHRWWSVPYGLAAMTLPVLLFTSMLVSLGALSFRAGPIGVIVWSVAALFALLRLLAGIIRVAFPPPPPAVTSPAPC
ncbi:M50 family metallopeptidase [Streptomyces sp. ASQP_92]|uniref:M50 family metallopeptidase n=1 Tax=Streptomyces sp. ASQP_92 TaxID=2979116 RepID=UPI0021BE80FD|nr:M50 family metallopeptidase [Streptomyces sp. ASQP_92]MCT9094160.1 M50 family metallopeptidase [Streptomyces sp. ASQP_92]